METARRFGGSSLGLRSENASRTLQPFEPVLHLLEWKPSKEGFLGAVILTSFETKSHQQLEA
jgi:hypothetical protein